jgi:hypothetical protein
MPRAWLPTARRVGTDAWRTRGRSSADSRSGASWPIPVAEVRSALHGQARYLTVGRVAADGPCAERTDGALARSMRRRGIRRRCVQSRPRAQRPCKAARGSAAPGAPRGGKDYTKDGQHGRRRNRGATSCVHSGDEGAKDAPSVEAAAAGPARTRPRADRPGAPPGEEWANGLRHFGLPKSGEYLTRAAEVLGILREEWTNRVHRGVRSSILTRREGTHRAERRSRVRCETRG